MPDIRRIAVGALAASAAAFALPAVLTTETAAAYSYGERTLARGMSGKDVRTAQVLLRRTGASIQIDGAFGRGTHRALKRFERSAELRRDGRLTPEEAPTLRTKADEAVAERRSLQAEAEAPQEDPAADPTAGDPYPTGGSSPTDPIGVTGAKAVVNPDGTATAPASAPQEVKDIIAAGNEIADKPYKYGGGHGKWKDSGYDCSGSVSYALHGAGLLDSSMPSGGFTSWGDAGRGEWVTIYAHGGHMYMVVAGIRFDTSGAKPSRWQTKMRSPSGFTARHPAGL